MRHGGAARGAHLNVTASTKEELKRIRPPCFRGRVEMGPNGSGFLCLGLQKAVFDALWGCVGLIGVLYYCLMFFAAGAWGVYGHVAALLGFPMFILIIDLGGPEGDVTENTVFLPAVALT